MPEDFLATSLQYLKGVGPRRAADLARAGLHIVEDLLYRFPLRYEDRSRFATIASLKPGQSASIAGRILSCGLRSTRRPGFKIFEAAVQDSSATIRVSWLNQPFLRDVFASGQHVVLFGLVEMRGHGGLQLTNPQYEILDDEDADTIHTGRIVPVYERAGSVTPKMQRRLMYDVLQHLPSDLPDVLPEAVRLRLNLPTRRASLVGAHFPAADLPVAQLNRFDTPAQRGLIFEEAFLFQMGLLARRRAAAAEQKPAVVTVDDRIRASARAVLPFKLTGGQRSALKDIVDDMQRPAPMNRLLQGDVGAGKTIVALIAALVAMENGLQVAFMAPTEILAEQHFLNISRLLQNSRFRVALLTGSAGAAKRREQLAEIEAGTLAPGRGHARTRPGRRALQAARAGDHRRTAPVRRAAAGDAPIERPAARRAGDDGDADPTHAGADAVRRPGRVADSRAAAGPAAGHARLRNRNRAATRSTRSSRTSSRPAGRRTSSTRSSRSRPRSISRPRPRWPTRSLRTCSRHSRSDCCTGA